ncbi:amino acid aminotransferase [Paenirhodobacter enshiensis]|uniref:Aromatic amino acid aminotransferase n=1 Tax=Paenirhodobacter enshiensis TaxID=1105367 RepID=A0A086Y3B2_9RHOB|nr:amino acid aminotransferase [Paenirhodobacter enshiensis]KFI28762.1 aromatic amino acid aminotransferase [Paenirhodobacter enshiensis]
MFGTLKPQAPDAIIQLIAAFRDDPRENKVDLGVGVYKNAEGRTPVMRAVREAERRIWEAETTKTYISSLAGEASFHEAMAGLVLGADYPKDRLSGLQSVGGTGAVRQGFEIARLANPDTTVWVPDPTWPNHVTILDFMHQRHRPYRYFDAETRTVAFDAMLADLEQVKPGDLVLLHGCCHNPTGANPTLAQWAEIADLLLRKGAVPLVDLAYQGFGDGLEEDAAGTRLIAARLPEVLIAASCSKNFGIYRERTGCLLVLTDPSNRAVMQGTLAHVNRQTFSFPPDHGARIVQTILTTPELRADWEAELTEVRNGMLSLRRQLADELRRLTNSDRFDFLAGHRGMFSRLGATPEQVEKMRLDSGIYMVGDSRMNIAGLNEASVPVLARAIVDAGV